MTQKLKTTVAVVAALIVASVSFHVYLANSAIFVAAEKAAREQDRSLTGDVRLCAMCRKHVSCGNSQCTYDFSLVVDDGRRVPVEVTADSSRDRETYTVNFGSAEP